MPISDFGLLTIGLLLTLVAAMCFVYGTGAHQ